MLANLNWTAIAVGPVVAALLLVPIALWKRWGNRTVDRVDTGVRRRLTRFHRHYREYVRASLRYIDLKGLVVVGFHTPEFEDVFVDVSLAYQTPHNAQAGVLARLPDGRRHSVVDFLDRREPAVLAIIGVPGSGKTTLLRHLALTVSRTRRRRRRVPVLLYLRDHVADIVAGASLPDLVRTTLRRYGPLEPPGWFEQRLRAGDCVVLLDGLDEVARPEDRRKVAAWVESQVGQHPRNDFVVTSRPQGYRSAPVQGAVVLQVRDFTDEQVARFVRGWYSAIEKLSTGGKGDAVRLRAEQAADELLAKLDANPALRDLTVNPLLLTMVANVHRFGSKLPDSRAELYREICEVMLWRRHEAKDLPVELGGDQKEVLLRSLAFTMMSDRVRDLPRAEILGHFRPALRRMTTPMTEEALLDDVSSNGLLVERENGVFTFAHQTFQEYLAAAHIRDKGLVDVLAVQVDDDWWRETTLLYAARSDVDPIVEACLESDGIRALSLAFDCEELGRELSPALRDRLRALTTSALDDPERRQVIAAVMLHRELREVIPTQSGRRIHTRPVSAGLYRLFELDTGRDAREVADPQTPVLGVAKEDGQAFARWANAVVDIRVRYALPTHRDAVTPAVSRAVRGRSFWLDSGALCFAGAKVPAEVVWQLTRPGPYRIDLTILADQLIDEDTARVRVSGPGLREVRFATQPGDLEPFTAFLRKLASGETDAREVLLLASVERRRRLSTPRAHGE